MRAYVLPAGECSLVGINSHLLHQIRADDISLLYVSGRQRLRRHAPCLCFNSSHSLIGSFAAMALLLLLILLSAAALARR